MYWRYETMKALNKFMTYEYESYEEYLNHALIMTKSGWKFSSQRNNHKEVTWAKFYL